MKTTYSAVFNHPNVNLLQFTGLSENQLIKTMLEQGIHTVSSLTHDPDGSGHIRPVEGEELISIWRQVHRIIQQRKH